KEIELETDSTVETIFYLKQTYDNAVAASNSQGRQAGRSDVTETPGSFNLTTIEAYDAVVAERDARPTQNSYDAILAERDARFFDTDEDGITDLKELELEADLAVETNFYLQGTYDAAVAASNTQGRQVGRLDVTENLGDYGLTTVEAYNTVVAERDARPTQNSYDAVLAERDARFIDTDGDGLTDVKEIELETEVAVETNFYLQADYYSAVLVSNSIGRLRGRLDVATSPDRFNLISLESYNAVVAERDLRFIDTDKDGLTDVKEAELGSDNKEFTPFYLQDAYDLGIESARFEGRSEVTNDPNSFSLVSNAQYSLVVAQRDARPTLGEVKDARLGSVVLQPDNGNNSVKIRFSIEETDDLKVWTKRDEINEITVPLELGSKFYRFALQDE
ncbi:hypothetical protein N9Z78_03080, partial [Akkermansiaceae bacterium]|nr:hypothetical protein [Akkermansiaceae bacterium]